LLDFYLSLVLKSFIHNIIFMIEMVLGIFSAIGLCDAAIIYGVFMDYKAEKAAKKVKTFGEYFWKSSNFARER